MTNRNVTKVARGVAALLAVAAGTVSSGAQTFNPATDFSATNNPTGPWSYGYFLNGSASLTLHTNALSAGGLDIWRTLIPPTFPLIAHNFTTNTISVTGGRIDAGQLVFQPGTHNELSALRFTAPAPGDYRLFGGFSGIVVVGPGTTADVHILVNGDSVLDGLVNGSGPSSGPFFNIILALNTGDLLDFAVGFGTNNNAVNDIAALAVDISLEPRPAISLLPSPNALTLRWPSSASGYVLESAFSLPSPNEWQPVTNATETVGEWISVTVGYEFSSRFFRLRKPLQ